MYLAEFLLLHATPLQAWWHKTTLLYQACRSGGWGGWERQFLIQGLLCAYRQMLPWAGVFCRLDHAGHSWGFPPVASAGGLRAVRPLTWLLAAPRLEHPKGAMWKVRGLLWPSLRSHVVSLTLRYEQVTSLPRLKRREGDPQLSMGEASKNWQTYFQTACTRSSVWQQGLALQSYPTSRHFCLLFYLLVSRWALQCDPCNNKLCYNGAFLYLKRIFGK